MHCHVLALQAIQTWLAAHQPASDPPAAWSCLDLKSRSKEYVPLNSSTQPPNLELRWDFGHCHEAAGLTSLGEAAATGTAVGLEVKSSLLLPSLL